MCSAGNKNKRNIFFFSKKQEQTTWSCTKAGLDEKRSLFVCVSLHRVESCMDTIGRMCSVVNKNKTKGFFFFKKEARTDYMVLAKAGPDEKTFIVLCFS
jgi:hypothetical protein